MPFKNMNLTDNINSFIHSTWEIIGETGIQFVKVRLGKMDKEQCQEHYRNIEALSDGINAFSQICTINSVNDTNGCKVSMAHNTNSTIFITKPFSFLFSSI